MIYTIIIFGVILFIYELQMLYPIINKDKNYKIAKDNLDKIKKYLNKKTQ